MIVLDTNVISGLMDAGRDPHLVPWLDGLDAEIVWITAIAVFEIKGGIDSLVESRRKRVLQAAYSARMSSSAWQIALGHSLLHAMTSVSRC